MADEKDTEQKTGSSEAAENPTIPVKKKAAKKKAAKKKVAKKKAASKKTAVKQPDSVPTPAPKPSQTEPKSTAAATSPPTETLIEARFEKSEPSEEYAMTNESKSSGVFWVKVIFWLVVIALIFMLIRSMAKHPDEQSSGMTGEASQEVTPAAAVPSDPPHMADEKPVSTGEAAPPSGEEQATTGETGQPAQGTSSVDQTTDSSPTAGTSATDIPAGAYDWAPAAPPPAPERPEITGGQEDVRDIHDESVAKILQEFDDLREAARAEMEAMRNLIQAERELREAIMAPRQPPGYPQRRAPGSAYGPYGPAPQYPRY